jgi:hypothetical protein
MGNRVRRVKTDISASQMAQAISGAWRKLFGDTPSKEQVAMVLAQNALETGHRKSMWNYNVGNITTDSKGPYDYFDDLTTKEQVKPGSWKKMNLKYRAYPSLQMGAEDYLKFISGKKYSEAWQHILNPDPVKFSKALKAAGYYTANEEPYTKSLTKLYSQYSKSNAESSIAMVPKVPANDNSLTNILDSYLQMVAASERKNKRLYKKMLPYNNILVKVNSDSYTNSVEFARILCSALEEELMANAYTHTDGQEVEIECNIPGPSIECLEVTKQLTNSVVEAFQVATNKIGKVLVNTECFAEQKSIHSQINLKSAEHQHKKFLLKFI